MPPRNLTDGERVAALQASVEAFETYERERWHRLDNQLQVLIGMPTQMTRDIAKLEGKLEAKIDGRLMAIEARLSSIEAQRNQTSGAQRLGDFLFRNFIAIAAVVAAFFAGHAK